MSSARMMRMVGFEGAAPAAATRKANASAVMKNRESFIGEVAMKLPQARSVAQFFTTAARARGNGSSGFPVETGRRGASRTRLGNELRVHGDVRVQHFGDGAARLGLAGQFLKDLVRRAGDRGFDIEMARGDGEAAVLLLECDRRRG